MGTIIITIIIVYVGWLVLKPLIASYARRKFEQRVRDTFRTATGYDPFESFREAERRRQEQEREAARRHSRKRKIFDRNEGEYVEFEEINVKMESSPLPPGYNPREPQVSDAEWEDL